MWDRWSLSTPPGQLTLHDEQNIDPPGNPTPPCDRQAVGVAPLVVRSGPNAGRLVVAYRLGTSPEFARRIEWCYHNGPVAGSPDGWSSAGILSSTTVPLPPEPIHGYNGDSLAGAFEAQNFPSIAADPNNPDVVYISFAGSATAVATGHDQNVDIYIARVQFVGTEEHTVEVKRITDEMLGELAGSDQFFPVVTVDGYGGINLAYVWLDITEVANMAYMRIKYTRMPNWSTLPTPDVTLALTPYFPVPHLPSNPAQQGIDEYISIASSGCLIYVSHFECEPEFNYSTTNVYVTRLSICPADVDDNGLVEIDDVAAFGAAYASQANPADVNRDGLCNASDIAAFLNAYACGCGTP